jgi:5'(3')-deoxyribonucleotidase
MRVNDIVSKKSIESIFEDLDPKSEVYVDMDGVLADFFGVWNQMMGVRHWKEIKDTDAALQKIKDTKDFWINLPMTRNGKSLLNAIKRFKGKYNILSAPLPGDPNSEPQKREWIQKHLSMFPPSKIIIDHNKAAYAKQADGTPNALIDDFGQNISKWENAGGVGIQHKDIQVGNTISKLAKALDNKEEETDLTEEQNWKQFYNQARTQIDDIEPFLRKHGYDPDDDASVTRFFDRNPQHLNLGKYINTPKWMAKMFKPAYLDNKEFDAIYNIRDRFKSEYPNEYDLIKQGRAQEVWDKWK